MFQVNNRNTRTRCEISSKLTIKTPERRQWHRSGMFIVNFVHISHLVLVFLLLTLSKQMPAGKKINYIQLDYHGRKIEKNYQLELPISCLKINKQNEKT